MPYRSHARSAGTTVPANPAHSPPSSAALDAFSCSREPNSAVAAPSRWTINGRFLTQKVTGVQRYARSIVDALDDLLFEGHPAACGMEVEILMPRTSARPTLRAISVRQVGPFSGHVWEQVTLPARARGPILSLCNTGPIAARRQIVCIHDLNTLLFPTSYSPAFRALYRILPPLLGRVASTIATVSRFSAGELARRGVSPTDKLVVIPNGHEHVFAWGADDQDVSPAMEPDTIVLLGSLAPHKNIGLILGMADKLAAHGLRIAVIGRQDARVFRNGGVAAEAGVVSWLGALPDADLARLLRSSLCLAFPSLAEGFGLPPLEAMALGCPVVVSDRTSLPEVCGGAALYAPPDRPSEWLDAFLRLKNDAGLRAAMAAKGRDRAALFSWRRSGELYLGAMARVAERS